MNYTEKINKVILKITATFNYKKELGSGILFLPNEQSMFVYALTAKHCVVENNVEATRISLDYLLAEDKTCKSYELLSTDKILCHQTNDLAILVIPKANIEALIGKIPCIMLSPVDTLEEKCSFIGYPCAVNNEKARAIYCTIKHENCTEEIIHINTLEALSDNDNNTKDEVKGFSGSGVYLHTEDDIFLLGIVTEIEAWNARFPCVNIACISDLLKGEVLEFGTPRNVRYNGLIKKASKELAETKNYFGDYTDSHIERQETSDIFTWIKSDLPPKQENIAILLGDGGLGKTVVLKDLFEKLEAENIPTLAIKSDKYAASDRVVLEHKLFAEPNIRIIDALTSLTKSGKKAVVLIDQLDALSLTLSSDRSFLTT